MVHKHYEDEARKFGLEHGGYMWVDHHYGWDWYLCPHCFHIFKIFLEVDMDHDQLSCPFCEAHQRYTELESYARARGGHCITTLSESLTFLECPDKDYYNNRSPVICQCAAGHTFPLYEAGYRWCPVCNDYSVQDRFWKSVDETVFNQWGTGWYSSSSATDVPISSASPKTLTTLWKSVDIIRKEYENDDKKEE